MQEILVVLTSDENVIALVTFAPQTFINIFFNT